MSTVYTNPKPAFTFLEESWTPPRELGINSRFFAPGLKRPMLTESEGYHVIEFPTVEGFTETSPGFGIDHSVPGVAQDVITGELSTRSVAPAPQWRLDVWERSILLVPDQIGSLGLSHGKHGRFYKGLLAPFCLENNNTKKTKKNRRHPNIQTCLKLIRTQRQTGCHTDFAAERTPLFKSIVNEDNNTKK